MKTFTLPIVLAALAFSGCSNDNTAQANDRISEAGAKDVTTKITDMNADEASILISSDPSLVVLDVRTPPEFAEGHIDGAINVDFRATDFASNLEKLDRTKRYVLHCKSGRRSSGALKVMQEQSFLDIAHLTGGFDAWKEAGQPIAQ